MPSTNVEARRLARAQRTEKLLALRTQADRYLELADEHMNLESPASVRRAQAYAAMASATVDVAMLHKWTPTTTEELNRD